MIALSDGDWTFCVRREIELWAHGAVRTPLRITVDDSRHIMLAQTDKLQHDSICWSVMLTSDRRGAAEDALEII